MMGGKVGGRGLAKGKSKRGLRRLQCPEVLRGEHGSPVPQTINVLARELLDEWAKERGNKSFRSLCVDYAEMLNENPNTGSYFSQIDVNSFARFCARKMPEAKR